MNAPVAQRDDPIGAFSDLLVVGDHHDGAFPGGVVSDGGEQVHEGPTAGESSSGLDHGSSHSASQGIRRFGRNPSLISMATMEGCGWDSLSRR